MIYLEKNNKNQNSIHEVNNIFSQYTKHGEHQSGKNLLDILIKIHQEPNLSEDTTNESE